MSADIPVTPYQALIRLIAIPACFIDEMAIALSGRAPLPPAHLRIRVHGTTDLASFLEVGQRSVDSLADALSAVGADLEGFSEILDFGCGCGRTLIPLHRRLEGARLHGTDIDAEAIAWCSRHLQFASCSANEAEPPLAYEDEAFDLIYAISVFTHLEEAHQFRWLQELQRITQPGGIVLASIHGKAMWQGLPEEWVERLKKRGISEGPGLNWKGIFPDWYKNTYHTERYVTREFDRFFEVAAYLPAALARHDLVVLRRR